MPFPTVEVFSQVPMSEGARAYFRYKDAQRMLEHANEHLWELYSTEEAPFNTDPKLSTVTYFRASFDLIRLAGTVLDQLKYRANKVVSPKGK